MNRISTSSSRRRLAAAGALLCALVAAAQAQSVAFSGMLGDKALLIINGQARGVAVGATVEGVKLVRLDGTQAQVEAGGKTQTLRLGGTAVLAGDTGGRGKGTRIVLPVGSGGHYTAMGAINGHSVPFLVDTGATTIAMGADVANRLGLDPADSTQSAAMTANGAVATRTITLRQVTIGDVTVYNVEAMVMPQAMPVVLLGNSFLSHFQMHSDNDTLVLDKKN
ncbi:retropepsin-like aspartic protease family protein [Scleromatobacter humisilvae]|uniref:Retroviral-like aspartic protease family protein n=1 Tax=Scleromatobacter humisilvae TaxID=2897159 RepID=A0A9X1YNS8_9BURK|nr:retropepsin-like aspartic protease [Scleromatobacter humisilvae]MCK9689654.1 retroviral-like aspartic protease family protein [Scleromatobacter humisilvae]